MDDPRLKVQMECLETLSVVAYDMSAMSVELANRDMQREVSKNLRAGLLFAAVAKLRQTARVMLVLQGQDATDEIYVLLRSMTELVINSCYLQYASEEELTRYMNHEPISLYVAMSDLVRTREGMPSGFEDGFERQVREKAQQAAEVSNLTLKSRVWSTDSRNLKDRADVVDYQIGRNDFAGVLAALYVPSSSYVHGSYKVLYRYMTQITKGLHPSPLHILRDECLVAHGLCTLLGIFVRFLTTRLGEESQELAQMHKLAYDTVGISSDDFAQKANRADL